MPFVRNTFGCFLHHLMFYLCWWSLCLVEPWRRMELPLEDSLRLVTTPLLGRLKGRTARFLPFQIGVPRRKWSWRRCSASLPGKVKVFCMFKLCSICSSPICFVKKSAMKKSNRKQFQRNFGFRWFRCGKNGPHVHLLAHHLFRFHVQLWWVFGNVERSLGIGLCACKGSCWLVTGMILVELHSMFETQSIGFMVSIAKFLFWGGNECALNAYLKNPCWENQFLKGEIFEHSQMVL